MKKLTRFFYIFLINFVIILLYYVSVKSLLISYGYQKLPDYDLIILSIIVYSIPAFIANYHIKQMQYPPIIQYIFILLGIISLDTLIYLLRFNFNYLNALNYQIGRFPIFFITFFSLLVYSMAIIEVICSYFRKINK